MNTNRKPYTIYRMVPLSMTLSDLWPDFKVTTFSTLNISETKRYSHSYYRTSTGSHALYRLLTFPTNFTDPNPVFKVTTFLKSKTVHLKRQSFYRTLINHTSLSNGTTFNDLQWPWMTQISRSRHFWSRIS